jgi:hypothetical protein
MLVMTATMRRCIELCKLGSWDGAGRTYWDMTAEEQVLTAYEVSKLGNGKPYSNGSAEWFVSNLAAAAQHSRPHGSNQ